MWLRMVLGLLFLAMALGQSLSWSAMPTILDAYGLTSGAATVALAAGLIAGHLVAGSWFVARPRSQAMTPVWVFTAVAVAWTVLGVQAWLRGVPVGNCGCFGVYLAQRLSWFTLAQDALLLGYAVLLFRAARRSRARVIDTAAGSGVAGLARQGRNDR